MKNKLNDRDFITIGIVIYMAVVFAMATTVIGGIICDFIIGNYESEGRMIIGYGTFTLADFLGTVISVILFGTAFFVERASKWKMSEAQINEALSYFKVSWAVAVDLPLLFLLE